MTAATQSGEAADRSTESQELARELAAWKQRYELLVAASGQLVYEYDVKTGNTLWIGNLAEVAGYSPAEMAGGIAKWIMRVHPEDRERVAALLKEAEQQGTTYDTEYRFLHKDGQYRWIHDRGFLMKRSEPEGNLMIGIMQDVTRVYHLEEELKRQVRTDALTGALNRSHFLSVAEHELARAIRYKHPLSVLLLDVDEISKICDSHGEQTGQLVLQMLAELCWENLRHVDSVGRLENDTFAVLLPETDEFQATDIAVRLHKSVERAVLPLASGVSLRFTISIGVASLKDDMDMLGLLQRAESALQEAHRSGRNRIANG